MNKPSVLAFGVCAVSGLLLSLLVACSSTAPIPTLTLIPPTATSLPTATPTASPSPTHTETATPTATPVPTFVSLSECFWECEAYIWLDRNENGIWDDTETPLTEISAVAEGVSGQFRGFSQVSNQNGVARLELVDVNCNEYPNVQIRVTIPDNYHPTTPISYTVRRSFSSVFFGLSIDTPTPEPTVSPSP